MAKSKIDAYSPCPGGTGKKIKFCCNDLLGDLQKIDRMLESDQAAAALTHIDGLRAKDPDRACLLAIRGLLLRAMRKSDEAAENARHFVEKHPDNQVARAEAAIMAANAGDARVAMDHLQTALEIRAGEVQMRVYEALGATAGAMVRASHWSAARSLLQIQTSLQPDDEGPARLLMRLFGSAQIPLLLRDEPRWLPMPDDAPWADRLQQAIQIEQNGLWRKAEPMVAELTAESPDAPVLWQQLARLRGQLADRAGQAEALRRFAALDVPWDEAVEAEAIAMLLGDDPLGDQVEVGNVRWGVSDVAKLEEALAFDRRAVNVPFNPAELADDEGPPPKSVYWLLSRPEPNTDEGVSPETIPRMLGQLMVFGRQTDREARLELLGVAESERDTAVAMLREIATEALDGEPEFDVVAHISGSQELLQVQWWPPESADPDALNAMVDQYHEDALLKLWPERPLGVLDGRSPREVSQSGQSSQSSQPSQSDDESIRRRLAGAILVLQAITERVTSDFDFNRLRETLGLPVAGPIDPDELPIDQLPVIRYDRVMVEKLHDEPLRHGFRKAMVYRYPAAMRRFAQAIIDRESMAGSDEQIRAYTTLAQMETDPAKAAAIYDQGRSAADAAGRSHANFDLAELAMWFSRGDSQQIMRLMDHIQREHIEEPGVREAFMQMLVQFGMLNPDGTPGPVITQARQAQAAAGGVPGGPHAAPAEQPSAAAESGKLWTPDAAGETSTSGGSKLWTPD